MCLSCCVVAPRVDLPLKVARWRRADWLVFVGHRWNSGNSGAFGKLKADWLLRLMSFPKESAGAAVDPVDGAGGEGHGRSVGDRGAEQDAWLLCKCCIVSHVPAAALRKMMIRKKESRSLLAWLSQGGKDRTASGELGLGNFCATVVNLP